MISKKIFIIFTTILLVGAVLGGLLAYFFYFGTVTVETTPSNAIVKIGDSSYQTDQEIKLRPGKYDITIQADGYVPYTVSGYNVSFLKKSIITRTLITANEQKLQSTLPYDDGLNFTITVRNTPEKYVYDIGLYAILNRPDQLQTYIQQLKALKPLPLEYISSYGVDPNKISINWLQPEVNK